jgi:hypothetical protein
MQPLRIIVITMISVQQKPKSPRVQYEPPAAFTAKPWLVAVESCPRFCLTCGKMWRSVFKSPCPPADMIAYRVSRNKYAFDKLASSPLHSKNINIEYYNTFIRTGLDISRQSFDHKT